MNENRLKKLNLFEYDNYRAYLIDWARLMKIQRRSFSFRAFAKAAGMRAPNFLKLVMDGARNLSPASIEKFAKVLKLGKEEVTFFRNLVMFNQAGTVEEKNFYAEQLMRSKSYRHLNPLKRAEYDYYAQWYFIPIREMIALENFQDDPEWIAAKLNPPITSQAACKALDELIRLGLVQRDQTGKLRQSRPVVATEDEVSEIFSASVARFHKEMIHKGAEALDRFDQQDREVSSVTLSLTTPQAQELKKMIQKFRREVLHLAQDNVGVQDIYQFNFQLFPLTRSEKRDEQHK